MADWRKLIDDLRAAPVSMSYYKISVCLGIQVVQVQCIHKGTEPKHSIGERILELHRLAVKKITVPST